MWDGAGRNGLSFQMIREQTNIIRRGTAAAAKVRNAKRRIVLHDGTELFRGNVVLVGIQIRQSGIRFDENRQAGPIAQLPCKGENFSRAQRAVDSHRVRAQSFQRERHGGNRNAGEGAAVRLKAHGTEHGQGSVLFCGKERGFDLQKIGHGFKHQEISASFRPRCNGFAENIIGIFKPKISVRFQQRTDRAAGESDKRSGFLCRFPRAGDTRLNDFPR